MTKVLEAVARKGKPRKQREDFAERNENLQKTCNDYASFGNDKIFFLETIVKHLKFAPEDLVDPAVVPADLVEPVDSIVSDDPEAEQNVQNEADSDVPDLLEESGL